MSAHPESRENKLYLSMELATAAVNLAHTADVLESEELKQKFQMLAITYLTRADNLAR